MQGGGGGIERCASTFNDRHNYLLVVLPFSGLNNNIYCIMYYDRNNLEMNWHMSAKVHDAVIAVNSRYSFPRLHVQAQFPTSAW